MTTHQRLTTKRIGDARPGARDIWLSDDDGSAGTGRLLLRVGRSGTKKFYFRFTTPLGRRTVPIGHYSKNAKLGFFTLAQARTEGRLIQQRAHLAKDKVETPKVGPKSDSSENAFIGAGPSGRIARELSSPSSAAVGSLHELCIAYVDNLRSIGKVSWTDYAGFIKRHIANEPLGAMEAYSVTSELVTDLLRRIVETGNRRGAGKLRSILHAAYAVAIRARLDPLVPPTMKRFGITTNPVASVAALADLNTTRERFLSGSELALLWHELNHGARSEIDITYRFLRITLLLGGQRCEQLNIARIENIDFNDNVIAIFDKKGRRAKPRRHVLPMCGACLDEVVEQVQLAKSVGSHFLFFGQKPEHPLRSDRVIKQVAKISNKICTAYPKVQPFRYGDLRRTTESQLEALGVSKDVRAQLLSHGLSGIQTRHYERYPYMKEKRDALEKWEGFLRTLLDPS